MIKDEIITAVCLETGVSRMVTEKVLQSLSNNITKALSRDEKVQFAGFGTFKPKRRAARLGRNPHTGEAVPIPARIIPCFEPGKNLMASVCRNIKGDSK